MVKYIRVAVVYMETPLQSMLYTYLISQSNMTYHMYILN